MRPTHQHLCPYALLVPSTILKISLNNPFIFLNYIIKENKLGDWSIKEEDGILLKIIKE